MALDEVERLLRAVRLDQVAPVNYSRKSMPVRVVLLLVFLVKTMLGKR